MTFLFNEDFSGLNSIMMVYICVIFMHGMHVLFRSYSTANICGVPKYILKASHSVIANHSLLF